MVQDSPVRVVSRVIQLNSEWRFEIAECGSEMRPQDAKCAATLVKQAFPGFATRETDFEIEVGGFEFR